jgi:large subunit ribosomal protein L25
MEKISLDVSVREGKGKGFARSLRRSGRIPAILYSKGGSTPITLDPTKLRKLLMLGHAESTLIDLKIEGAAQKAERVAILRDYQTDPLTGELLHTDFFEVSMDEKIRVTVPVELTAETPAGVKEGGILQFVLREVELECLPSLIPSNIIVDASKLNIGESLHVRDINVPEEIRIMIDPEQVVLTIASPVSQEKLDQLLTTPSAAEAVKEPELVKKPAKEGEKVEEKEGKA